MKKEEKFKKFQLLRKSQPSACLGQKRSGKLCMSVYVFVIFKL